MKKLFGIVIMVLLVMSGCQEDEGEKTRILFLGDTYFGEEFSGFNPEASGYTYSFENFRGILDRADLVFANLETPLTDLDKSPLEGEKAVILKSQPEEAVAALRELGIDIVNLANNHTMDYGQVGLDQTMAVLEESGIEHLGAGDSEAEAIEPIIREFQVGDRSIKMAFFGAYQYSPDYLEKFDFYADEEKGGVNILALDPMIEKIKEVDEANPGIFIVVYPHWGDEYRWKSIGQANIAIELVDAGVDLIVGHGTHVMQEVEKYGLKWLAYGLGNFVLNGPDRHEEEGKEPISLMMEVILEEEDGPVRPYYRFYPIYTDNSDTNYQPRFATAEEFEYAWKENGEPGEKGEDEFGRYFEVGR